MAKFRKNSKGHYSKRARETALKIYVEDGPAVAAKETGISATTIRQWAKRSGVTDDRQKRTQAMIEAASRDAAEKRETIKLQCRRRALDLLERFDTRHEYFVGKDGDRAALDNPTAGDIKDYSIAIGVLIDKAELLDGRATDRTEHRSTDQLDREIEKLLESADRGSRSPA
jgi:hypothetical protein